MQFIFTFISLNKKNIFFFSAFKYLQLLNEEAQLIEGQIFDLTKESDKLKAEHQQELLNSRKQATMNELQTKVDAINKKNGQIKQL